jgi:tetratricopeptide (TPR) repeat protein
MMTDLELVSALSVDRDQFTAPFHMAAQAELSRRGIRLSEFKNQVTIIDPSGEGQTSTIAKALEACSRPAGPFDVLSFTNCVGETLTFQPGPHAWVGHYVDRGQYRFSFRIGASQGRRELLRAFLELEDWSTRVAETFDISEWDILLDSSSPDRILGLAQFLAREQVPLLIADSRFFCPAAMRPDSCHGPPFKIMVPQQSLEKAQWLLGRIEQKVEELHLEAAQRIREGDRPAELSVLTELIQLVPNDPRAHYRRGVLLLEMSQPEAAADAFIASLIHHRGHEALSQAAYQGLEEISRKLPENVHVLHNLATFSALVGLDPQQVEATYRKIIALRPEDAMAHLHLGYLYYEQGDDVSAYRHLKRYLDLDPESEERDAIEQIIEGLRSIGDDQDDGDGD